MKKYLLFTVLFLITSSLLSAQSSKPKTDTSKNQIYTCTMHPEIHMNKPGKCPKCGMTLVPVKKSPMKMYTCTMHPEISSSKPGNCPKCGMALVEKKGGKNMDSSMHMIPMHHMDSSNHKMPM